MIQIHTFFHSLIHAIENHLQKIDLNYIWKNEFFN